MIFSAGFFRLLSFSAALLIATGLFSVDRANADGPGLDIQFTQGGQDLNNGSFSLGWTFAVTSPVSVSALGFYDAGQNGLSTSHDVGIYDANCNLVANTTVVPTDPLVGFFRYHDLASPVILSPGQTYRIAAVTGGEPYLYNPTAVVLDPAVVFDKFTAWHGAFQQTSTLQCPDFPAISQYYGDFGPTFYIGALSSNPSDPNKRDTSIKLFCNRSGDLSTANCSVTVGDTGAAPRTNPMGTVEFAASSGTLAGTSCQLSAVSLSPGVSSCSIIYVPPSGFPIGQAFPVSATYDGDSAFNPSSTSHEIIKAGCVGTTAKPCPNSVGIEFDRLQAILDKVITVSVRCGSGKQNQLARAAQFARVVNRAGLDIPPPGGACNMFLSLGLDLDALVTETSLPDLQALADAFKQQPKSVRDAVLEYVNAASTFQSQLYDGMQKNQAAADEIVKVLEKDLLNQDWLMRVSKYVPGTQFARVAYVPYAAARKKKKKPSLLKFATVTKTIGADKSATVRLKLNKRMQNLVAVFKDAGVATLPIKATMSVTQKKRRGKATLSQTVYVTLE